MDCAESALSWDCGQTEKVRGCMSVWRCEGLWVWVCVVNERGQQRATYHRQHSLLRHTVRCTVHQILLFGGREIQDYNELMNIRWAEISQGAHINYGKRVRHTQNSTITTHSPSHWHDTLPWPWCTRIAIASHRNEMNIGPFADQTPFGFWVFGFCSGWLCLCLQFGFGFGFAFAFCLLVFAFCLLLYHFIVCLLCCFVFVPNFNFLESQSRSISTSICRVVLSPLFPFTFSEGKWDNHHPRKEHQPNSANM